MILNPYSNKIFDSLIQRLLHSFHTNQLFWRVSGKPLKRFWSALHKVHPPTPQHNLWAPMVGYYVFVWLFKYMITLLIPPSVSYKLLPFLECAKVNGLLLKDWQLRFTVKCDWKKSVLPHPVFVLFLVWCY